MRFLKVNVLDDRAGQIIRGQALIPVSTIFAVTSRDDTLKGNANLHVSKTEFIVLKETYSEIMQKLRNADLVE